MINVRKKIRNNARVGLENPLEVPEGFQNIYVIPFFVKFEINDFFLKKVLDMPSPNCYIVYVS